MQQCEVQPINVLSQLIRQWAHDRNLIKGSNAKQQFLKLVEEFKETVEGETTESIMDGIGDSYVVLTIIAAQEGFNIEDMLIPLSINVHDSPLVSLGNLAAKLARGKNCEDEIIALKVVLIRECSVLRLDYNECIQIAYNEIKDRKGKMIDGVFVKEEDLPVQDVYEPLRTDLTGRIFKNGERVTLKAPSNGQCYCAHYLEDTLGTYFIFEDKTHHGSGVSFEDAVRTGWLIRKGDQ